MCPFFTRTFVTPLLWNKFSTIHVSTTLPIFYEKHHEAKSLNRYGKTVGRFYSLEQLRKATSNNRIYVSRSITRIHILTNYWNTSPDLTPEYQPHSLSSSKASRFHLILPYIMNRPFYEILDHLFRVINLPMSL
jgi:hypothetical protein